MAAEDCHEKLPISPASGPVVAPITDPPKTDREVELRLRKLEYDVSWRPKVLGLAGTVPQWLTALFAGLALISGVSAINKQTKAIQQNTAAQQPAQAFYNPKAEPFAGCIKMQDFIRGIDLRMAKAGLSSEDRQRKGLQDQIRHFEDCNKYKRP